MRLHYFFTPGRVPAWLPVAGLLVLTLAAQSLENRVRAQEATLPVRLAVPVEEPPFPAQVQAIDQDWKITFKAAGQRRTLPAQDLVTWGDYRDTCQHSQIVLAEGSVLVADVLQISGESLVVYGDLCGQVTLPLSAVRGVLVDPPLDPLRRDRRLQEIRTAQGTEDQLRLDNEDVVSGTLRSWRDNADATTDRPATIVLAAKGRELTVTVDTVVALILNPALVKRPPVKDGAVELGFCDGSLLRVARVTSQGGTTRLILPGAIELEVVSEWLSELTHLRSSSTRVVYLSELSPLGYKHIPFLETPWPLQRDHSAVGGRLRQAGVVCDKGLGMHSTSRVAYDLTGKFRRFQAEVALDDTAGLLGAVTFRVMCEAAHGQWQRAWESPVVRGGAVPLPVTVDLDGITRLALIVDFAEGGDVLDHANWLNARLIK